MTTHTELAAPTFAEFVDEAEATMEMVKRTFGTRGAPPKVIEAFATITMVEQLLKQCEQIRAAALESTERLAGGGERTAFRIDDSDAISVSGAVEHHRVACDEYRVEASRENEGEGWYITMIHPDGARVYDGYWRDSESKTAKDVMHEAIRGACLPNPTPPPQAERVPLSEEETPSNFESIPLEAMKPEWRQMMVDANEKVRK